MANLKVSELTALTTPATGDLLPIVDISDTTDAATGTTKKITLANLKASGAEVDTGTEDVKFMTPKAFADAGGYHTGGTDVAIADGGTGASTATNAFDALAPTTTQGDVIYHNGTDNVRLAKGTAGQVLKMNSGATAPEWGTNVTVAGGQTTKDVSSTTATTIAHGLSSAPKYVKVTAVMIGSSDLTAWTQATYIGSTQYALFTATLTGTSTEEEAGAGFRIYSALNTDNYTTGTITIDATNITISWSKTNTPTGTADLMWEAFV